MTSRWKCECLEVMRFIVSQLVLCEQVLRGTSIASVIFLWLSLEIYILWYLD
jgi:hypothetical protein